VHLHTRIVWATFLALPTGKLKRLQNPIRHLRVDQLAINPNTHLPSRPRSVYPGPIDLATVNQIVANGTRRYGGRRPSPVYSTHSTQHVPLRVGKSSRTNAANMLIPNTHVSPPKRTRTSLLYGQLSALRLPRRVSSCNNNMRPSKPLKTSHTDMPVAICLVRHAAPRTLHHPPAPRSVASSDGHNTSYTDHATRLPPETAHSVGGRLE
jgi:hypothetical protein